MTVDPFTDPVRVEGIPPGSSVGHDALVRLLQCPGHWQFVGLCKACLHVVAELTRNLLKDDPAKGTTSYQVHLQHKNINLCPFCGGYLRGEPSPAREWSGLHVARGRWHSTGILFFPWTWDRGWWEIKDFEKYMKPPADEKKEAG